MGQQYDHIKEKHTTFIEQQKMFFVGTATADSRVNISPKGMDSFKILSPNRVIWLNLTGSGNETSAHVQVDPRMTILFCAFEGKPLILRLYGQANVVHMKDRAWQELSQHFQPTLGARQIFDMHVDLVQTSCGWGVPLYDFVDNRSLLNQWAEKQGEEGIKSYWEKKNQHSLDDIPSHILEKNT